MPTGRQLSLAQLTYCRRLYEAGATFQSLADRGDPRAARAGDPKWESSQNLIDFPYAAYAEMLGLRSCRVEKPELEREPEAVAIVWQSVKEGMQGILPSRD